MPPKAETIIPPLTPRVKKALAIAVSQSRKQKLNYVSLDQLLVGMLRAADVKFLKGMYFAMFVEKQKMIEDGTLDSDWENQ